MYPASQVEPISSIASSNIHANGGVDNRSNAPITMGNHCLIAGRRHYRENPLVGMSCAIFEIPRSHRVIITGGSEICAWRDDDFPDDVHYSFTIIRTTLAVGG